MFGQRPSQSVMNCKLAVCLPRRSTLGLLASWDIPRQLDDGAREAISSPYSISSAAFPHSKDFSAAHPPGLAGDGDGEY